MTTLTYASTLPGYPGALLYHLRPSSHWRLRLWRFWLVLLLVLLLFIPDGGMWRSGGSFPVPPVPIDQSTISVPERQVRDHVRLIYQTVDGQLMSTPVDKERYSVLVQQQQQQLETARQRIQQQAQRELSAGMQTLFAEVQERIPMFTAWFHGYKTQYWLFYEALKSALDHLTDDQRMALITADVEAFLMKEYQYRVLKPEITDQRIAALYRKVLTQAHHEYLITLTTLQNELQVWVAQETNYLSASPPVVVIHLDWTAQSYRLRFPPSLHSGLDVWRCLALTTTGALVGKATGAAIGARLAAPLVSRALSTAGSASAFVGGGSIAGPLGAAGGLLLGAMTDYAIQQGIETLDRPQFEQEILLAVKGTQIRLTDKLLDSLLNTINVMFSDTTQILMRF